MGMTENIKRKRKKAERNRRFFSLSFIVERVSVSCSVDEKDALAWTIDDGDRSQLVDDERLAEAGVKVNTVLGEVICAVCGITLCNWVRHLQDNHGKKIDKLAASVVNDALQAAKATATDAAAAAHDGLFLQGVRAKAGWQCTCGKLCGSTRTRRDHEFADDHARPFEWTDVTLQRLTQSTNYIRVHSEVEKRK